MIFIKFFLSQNIINTNIRNNILLDILVLIKQLTTFYILFYTQSMLKHNILFITNINILTNNLKILQLLTSNSYLNNNNIQGLISNWKMLKKQIFLLRWLLCIIYFINSKKLKFSLFNIIKLFTLFLKLKKNYWGAINLISLPDYIFILSNDVSPYFTKEGYGFNSKIFFITTTFEGSRRTNKIFSNYNIRCFNLFLELVNTAHIQGYF